MTPYRMTYYKGKRSYDLTEDTSDEEIPTTTSAEVDQSKPYPTPSRSPEASSSQVHLQTHTDQNIRPINRSRLFHDHTLAREPIEQSLPPPKSKWQSLS